MQQVTAKPDEQFAASTKLEGEIRRDLERDWLWPLSKALFPLNA